MSEAASHNREELAEASDDIVALLKRFGEAEWSTILARDSALIRSGDFYGVERFLRAFGGMGSLNDLVLTGFGDLIVKPSDSSEINSMLSTLRGRAYAIARDLAREFEREHGA
jgi:hypothetical protein